MSSPIRSQMQQKTISSFFTSQSGTKPKRTPLANGHVNGTNGSVIADEAVQSLLAEKPTTTKGHKRRLSGQETESSLKRSRIQSSDQSPAPSIDRTSKYAFSSSPQVVGAEVDEDNDQIRRQKERLHQRFVQKLGRPDSIAEIKRRNRQLNDEGPEDAEGGDEPDSDDHDHDVKPNGKKTATRKKSAKLTPLETQYLAIKHQNLDTLLVVEVGYKYRFFGEDARIAAKELQIVCIPGKFRYDEHISEAHLNRFASASFPTHRLHVHVRRLVQAGHKVGVVRQLETAALKAMGDNRNAPFVRKLTNLYTKATYIDNTEGLDGSDASATAQSATGHLLCLTETNAKGWGNDEKVCFGIIAVQPTTGEIVYDDFEDGFMRTELETRFIHIAPAELLIIGETSKATRKLIEHLSGKSSIFGGDSTRIETVDKPKTMAAQAYGHISGFYADKIAESSSQADGASSSKTALLDKVHDLTESVTVCLSAMITHLTTYGLEHVFDLTKYFEPFSARSHMLLGGNTLISLEIYLNQTDFTEQGSLFWTLDRTLTTFGRRLLRKWIGRPLLDRRRLEERTSAVEEMLSSNAIAKVDRIKHLLRSVKGDLEKSLIRIYYKRCTRPELVVVLQTLQRIANEFAHVKSAADSGFESPLISEALTSLPIISTNVISFLQRINLSAAQQDDKYAFFREEFETEPIQDHKVGIVSVEYDLNEHKSAIAEILKKKKVDYVSSSGIEFLVEIDNAFHLKHVPASWSKISGTKKISRFHTPEVVKLIRERDQHKEALANACDEAFVNLLTEIGADYQVFRDAIQSLAILDCICSLAEVAKQPGYSKPEFVDDAEETCLNLSQARHPMVEQLLLDTYVPNDIDLSSSRTRGLLITGPNMGGKSSYVRSVALISIMAQIGSYVPADSARLSLVDAIFTRMGAFDNMVKGESTFMVELSETADILKQATRRSLVILDELGRGTSTHDGVAIAQAVLDYMMRDVQAMTLFITHYQSLSRMAQDWPQDELMNIHMQFTENKAADGETRITFLYRAAKGTAHRSYGLNVAHLAGLPKQAICVAGVKSGDMEVEERRRKLGYLGRLAGASQLGIEDDSLDHFISGIEQL